MCVCVYVCVCVHPYICQIYHPIDTMVLSLQHSKQKQQSNYLTRKMHQLTKVKQWLARKC